MLRCSFCNYNILNSHDTFTPAVMDTTRISSLNVWVFHNWWINCCSWMFVLQLNIINMMRFNCRVNILFYMKVGHSIVVWKEQRKMTQNHAQIMLSAEMNNCNIVNRPTKIKVVDNAHSTNTVILKRPKVFITILLILQK